MRSCACKRVKVVCKVVCTYMVCIVYNIIHVTCNIVTFSCNLTRLERRRLFAPRVHGLLPKSGECRQTSDRYLSVTPVSTYLSLIRITRSLEFY